MPARAAAEHELFVVEQPFDYHAVELVLDAVDILVARNELGHDPHL